MPDLKQTMLDLKRFCQQQRLKQLRQLQKDGKGVSGAALSASADAYNEVISVLDKITADKDDHADHDDVI